MAAAVTTEGAMLPRQRPDAGSGAASAARAGAVAAARVCAFTATPTSAAPLRLPGQPQSGMDASSKERIIVFPGQDAGSGAMTARNHFALHRPEG